MILQGTLIFGGFTSRHDTPLRVMFLVVTFVESKTRLSVGMTLVYAKLLTSIIFTSERSGIDNVSSFRIRSAIELICVDKTI